MKKKHILLIENDENEVEFFTEALEESRLNFLCSIARNTDQAVKMLRNIFPDIIFLDRNISGFGGFTVLDSIKQIQSLQKVPVILYSNIPFEKNKMNEDDEVNYLHLPGNVQTMAFMLQQLLPPE